MAEISRREAKKLARQNDTMKGRMRRQRADQQSMTARVAGGVGRGTGAWVGGRWTADKDIKGINIGWIGGVIGLTIQATMPGAGGQFVGGFLEGPMNGLLYKKGEDMS